MKQAIHLHPTAPLAERALLPGDPGRALRLAQALLAEPRMFNHNRGLWGYTGTASDGQQLTIQSTGMGGASAAIVITELAQLGVQRLVRVGTCGALSPKLELGAQLIVSEALTQDGTSQRLLATRGTPGEPAVPVEELLDALRRADPRAIVGPVVSTDLFYDPSGPESEWAEQGTLAVEMETAALFTLGAALGLRTASLLAVSDLILPERRRIDTDELAVAELQLGQTALQALMLTA